MDPTETNRQALHDLFAAADAGDLERVESYYSPRYVDHDPPFVRQGGGSHLENTIRAFRMFQSAFPDTRHTLHDVVAERDRVAARISAAGTHLGELFGIAPTGRRVSNDSIVIYRFEEGRIVERWCRERRGALEQIREAQGSSEVVSAGRGGRH